MSKLLMTIHNTLYVIRSNFGFSIPEALVTISVVGVIGLVLAGLILRVFQGNTKTELLGDVKQNGQVALSVMDQTIRNADYVVCSATAPYQAIAIQTKEGKFIRFYISPQTLNSNGYLAKQEFTTLINPNTQNICSFDQFPATANPTPSYITNHFSTKAVSVKSGTFKVNKQPGFKDTVSVEFEIGAAYNSGNTFENLLGGPTNSVSFKTSIQLR